MAHVQLLSFGMLVFAMIPGMAVRPQQTGEDSHLHKIKFDTSGLNFESQTLSHTNPWMAGLDAGSSSCYYYYNHDNQYASIWAEYAAWGPWGVETGRNPYSSRYEYYYINAEGASFWVSQIAETDWVAVPEEGSPTTRGIVDKWWHFAHADGRPGIDFPFLQLVNQEPATVSGPPAACDVVPPSGKKSADAGSKPTAKTADSARHPGGKSFGAGSKPAPKTAERDRHPDDQSTGGRAAGPKSAAPAQRFASEDQMKAAAASQASEDIQAIRHKTLEKIRAQTVKTLDVSALGLKQLLLTYHPDKIQQRLSSEASPEELKFELAKGDIIIKYINTMRTCLQELGGRPAPECLPTK